MRTLSLHESALSPSEYVTYIPLFDDLVDADHDATTPHTKPKEFNANANVAVPVREARGWLKGRYPGVESQLIDRVSAMPNATPLFIDANIHHPTRQILRIFHPALLPADILSQPQFFAVLRLLAHAHANTPGSRSEPLESHLVFVQRESHLSYSIFLSSFSFLACPPPSSSFSAYSRAPTARNSTPP
jgi:hypothetical protein